MSGSAEQTKRSFQHGQGGVARGLAQIESDGVVRRHVEFLHRRSGLKSALHFSVDGPYYFDGHLSVNRVPSFRRSS